MRALPILSRALALAFAAAFVVHLLALVHPSPADTSPAWRHAVFLGVNAILAIGFARCVRWLFVPVLVFAAQQATSHGIDFVSALRNGGLDVTSLLVLIVLPVVVVVAFLLQRRPRAVSSRPTTAQM